MAVPNALDPTFELVNAKQRIISATTEGATRTLRPSESGSLILLDRGAGIVITLPAPTATAGIWYDFITTANHSPNTVQIITSSGSIYIVGGIQNVDTDSADADDWFTTGSSAVSIDFNGSTRGAMIGSNFSLTSYSATRWVVDGIINASGTVSGPFRTTT